MLSDHCPVCLSVTLVYCSQMVGRIKMKLGMEVSFGPSHIALDGDPAAPTFRPMYCGQMARWIKIPLGTEISLGTGHIVLDRDPARPLKRGTAPVFRPMSVVAKWLDGARCHLIRR